MLFDLCLLVAPFASDFFSDIVLPAVVGAVVLIWIGNSILNKFGYTLW